MNTEQEQDENVLDDISQDEDIQYEEDSEIIEESGLQNKIKKLREELKLEKKQSQEYLTGWQKERASFANYKAEEEKNRKERIEYMKTNLISDFFPVLDSFDMAFSNKDAWEKVDSAWRTGVEYIHTQLMNILDTYKLQVIEKINIPFNPLHHDPVETIETDDESKSDTVGVIIQKGYMSGENVLRPAKVKVYKYTSE